MKWRNHYTLIGIMIVAVVLRVGLLGILPTGLKNDEISGALNARALMETGVHLSGLPWWRALFFTGSGYPMAELHSFFVMPGILLFGSNLLGARVMVAIFGSLTVLAIYYLANNLVNRNVGKYAALFLATNPWHVYISRSGFEAPIALFWYVCGLAFWTSPKRRLRDVGGAICMILAFHAYQGMKVVVPLTILMLVLWELRAKLKFQWSRALVIAWVLIYAPLFWLWSDQSTRVAELSFDRQSDLTTQIVQLRSYSGLPREIDALMFNKVTISIWDYLAKFFGLFSPERLFTGGGNEPGYVLWRHGLFYLHDVILLGIGAMLVYIRNRRLAYLLGGLIVITALPAVLSRVGISYMFRASATLMIFSIWGGVALYEIKSHLQGKGVPWKWSWIGIVTFSTSYFVVMYVGLMGAWGSQWYGFAERTMASYVGRQGVDEHVTVISNDPRNDFLVYAFYSNLSSVEIKNALQEQIYVSGKVRFVNDCPEVESDGVLIVDAIKDQCGKERSVALVESQRRFQIYGDKLCTNALSESYYRADWSIRSLERFGGAKNGEFCEDWFFRPI